MKPSSPPPGKRTLRRLLLLALVVALLAGGGVLLYDRVFSRAPAPGLAAAPALDAKEEEAWKKANAWLYNRAEYEPFRDKLILPLARANALVPRSLKKRGAAVEITFPAGRPIHEYAFDLEARCAAEGIAVVEGRETGPDQVEYRLKDAQGRPLTVKLLLGSSAFAGSVRMALVITGLGTAPDGDLAALLAFSEAVTLVLPDTHAVLRDEGLRAALESGPAVFLELPMEPANYPYLKPGPRALFIDHSRDQAEGVLRERLDAYPEARGFATVLGDRAIENPQLMESVLGFMASRSLVFLDLTGSPLSQTPPLSLKTGAESFSARVQQPGSETNLEAELDRRLGLAKKSGDGIWVLRFAPGLPASLTRLFKRRAAAFEELGLQWVPLTELRRADK